MATVDVDGSSLPADSEPNSVGLVLAAIWHQMNWINTRDGFGYDDRTISIIISNTSVS